MNDDLKGLAEGFGELSSFLDSIFGGNEEKGAKEDLTNEDLDRLRALISTNNIPLKNLVASLMLRYFPGKLSFQELEYFLHSRDRDIQVNAGKAIIDFHWKSIGLNLLQELIVLQDDELKLKIKDFLASVKKK